ncbi:hypothetical protein LEMLEM_LOCUS4132, partial [Lemmus lemmus]
MRLYEPKVKMLLPAVTLQDPLRSDSSCDSSASALLSWSSPDLLLGSSPLSPS